MRMKRLIFCLAAMLLAIPALLAAPAQLTVYKVASSSSSPGFSDAIGTLEKQSDGTYKGEATCIVPSIGEFDLRIGGSENGSTTYYCTAGGMSTTPISFPTIGTTVNFSGLKSGSNVYAVGAWEIKAYPAGAISLTLDITVDLAAGTGSFTLTGAAVPQKPVVEGDLYVAFGTRAEVVTVTDSDPVLKKNQSGSYTGEFDVAVGSYFKFYSKNQDGTLTYWATPNQSSLRMPNNNGYSYWTGLDYNSDMTRLSAWWLYEGFPNYNNTVLNVTVDIDAATVEIQGTKPAPQPGEIPSELRVCAQSGSGWNIGASDPTLSLQTDGNYTGTLSLAKDSKVKFYSKSDNGAITWYGPKGSETWNLTNDAAKSFTLVKGAESGEVGMWTVTGGASAKWPAEATAYVDLEANTAMLVCTADLPDIPAPRLTIPITQGMEAVTGFQVIWGQGYDWCPISFISKDAKSTMISVTMPNGETWQYKAVIDSNSPDDKDIPNYDNSLTLLNFMYSKGGVSGTWSLKGYYTLEIPANILFIEVDGKKVPNPAYTIKYYCAGNGGYFDQEYVNMLTPDLDQVLEFPTVTVAGTDTSFPGAEFRFSTSSDSNGYSRQLLCKDPLGVPVEVIFTPKGGGEKSKTTVYGTISTLRTMPNRVYVDMSSFKNEAGSEFPYPLGTYDFHFAEGVLYEEVLPYKDPSVNAEVTFTINVVDEIIVPKVILEFKGHYEVANVLDTMGIGTVPESPVYDYPLDMHEDADNYVTIQVPWEYEITVDGPDNLSSSDYLAEYGEDLTPDNEDVNFVQITFRNVDLCDGKTFVVKIYKEGEEPEPDDDAVEAIGAEQGESVYFDLLGRRVANPGKGIFIVNGKVIVKN